MIICSWWSRADSLEHWRVIFAVGSRAYYRQWYRGFAYPPKVTRSWLISENQARMDYNACRNGGQHRSRVTKKTPPWKENHE